MQEFDIWVFEKGTSAEDKSIKVYLQKVDHGVKFLGARIKSGHINISRRTARNFLNMIDRVNWVAGDHKLSREEMKVFGCSVNSYLVFCIHYNTFSFRLKTLWRLDDRIKKRMKVGCEVNKVKVLGQKNKGCNLLSQLQPQLF